MKTFVVVGFLALGCVFSLPVSAQTPGSKLWDYAVEPRIVIDPFTSRVREFPAYIFSTPAIGRDGTIFFGAANGKFYALNPDGSLKWSYTTDKEARSPYNALLPSENAAKHPGSRPQGC